MQFQRALLILAAALGVLSAPSIAQSPYPAGPPAPVAALPDTARITTYTLSGTNCACAVGFHLYGDGTDYQNWVEVWLNGVAISYNDASFGWTITSPSGQLSTLPRPITNAVLTFNNTQTGTVQIVGARRPRRTSQFSENRGVAARDLNQVFTDIVASQRETWDRTNDVSGRALLAPPGETLKILPGLATRKNSSLGFDANGNPVAMDLPLSEPALGKTAAFSTRTAFAAANVDAAANTVILAGYATANDSGKGAIYKRIACASAVAWGVQSADKIDAGGATCTGSRINWLLSNETVTFGMFGAVGDNRVDDTSAISNTCGYANAGLAGTINASPGANYRVWTAVPSPSNNFLCKFTASDITFNWNGATLTTALPFGGSVTSAAVVSTGNVSFTTAANAGWNAGDPIIVYVTNSSNEYTLTAYMTGTVASYSGTTLVVTVASSGGTPGTYTNWTFLPNISVYAFLMSGTASRHTHNDFVGVKTSLTRTYGAGVNWFASSGTGTGLRVNHASLTGGNCGLCLQSADLTVAGFTRWHFDGVINNVFYGIGLEAVGSYGDFNIQTINTGRSVILYNVSNISGLVNSTATEAGVIDDVVIEVQGDATFSGNTTDNIWIKYVNKNSTVGRNMATVINYPSAAGASASFKNINIDYDIDLSNIVAPFGYMLAMGGTKADGTCGDPSITYRNFNLSGVVKGNITSGLTTSMMFLPQSLSGVCGNYDGTSTGTFNVTNLVANSLTLPITIGAGATTDLANVYAPNMPDVIAEGTPNQHTVSFWNTTLSGLNSGGTLPVNRASMFAARKGSSYAVSVDKGAFSDWFDANGARQGQINADAGSGGEFIIGAITKGLVQTGGVNSLTWNATEFGPAIDNVLALGDGTHRYSAAYIASLTATCAAGSFISAIAANGTPTCSPGSVISLPNDTEVFGDLLMDNLPAPATPSANRTRVYVDSTQKIWTALNDAGTKSITVVSSSAPANQYATGLGSGGVLTYARPTCSNLSDAAASCATDATNAANIASGTLPPARLAGLNNISNVLSGDVSLNNIANYFDGPSIAQGSTGTWFASGTVTISDTGGPSLIACKLWDGTTLISATQITVNGSWGSMHLSGVLATPAANIKISCNDASTTTAKIIAAAGPGKSATLSAFRIN